SRLHPPRARPRGAVAGPAPLAEASRCERNVGVREKGAKGARKHRDAADSDVLFGRGTARPPTTAGRNDQRSGLQARGASKRNPSPCLNRTPGPPQPPHTRVRLWTARLRTQKAHATLPKTAAAMKTA